jgi:hypothetical protein
MIAIETYHLCHEEVLEGATLGVGLLLERDRECIRDLACDAEVEEI